MTRPQHSSPECSSFGDRVARESAHLYSNIVDWYVEKFFDDLEDGAWLREFAARVPQGGSVLDCGAGPGHFSHYLNQLGLRAVSSDIAYGMVAASRSLVTDTPAAVTDMRSIGFKSESFDGTLCAYSLMHVPLDEVPRVLSEFYRITRSGGILQLMLKLGDGAYRFRSGLVSGGQGFVQLWRPENVEPLLNAAGFDLLAEDSKPSSSPYELEHPKYMALCRARQRTAAS